MAIGLDAVRYSAANACVKGLASQLLPHDSWQNLLSAEDLTAALGIIRSTVYGEVVAEVEMGGTVNLQALEHHLSARAAANVRRTMTFLSGATRRLPQGILRRAVVRLKYLHIATTPEDLREPLSNRLELLSGNRAGQWSIRINDQWRLCFRFEGGHAFDVEIVDYH